MIAIVICLVLLMCTLTICRSEQLVVFLAVSWKMTGAQLAFYILPYTVQSAFLRLMKVMCRVGDELAVVCNPISMDRWSELMVVCVCHSDEVMREADAKDTSGELGSEFPGSFVGESVFRTAKLEILIEPASWLPLVSVVPECQSEW